MQSISAWVVLPFESAGLAFNRNLRQKPQFFCFCGTERSSGCLPVSSHALLCSAELGVCCRTRMQIMFCPVSAGGDLCLLPWAAHRSSHHLWNPPQSPRGLCSLLRAFHLLVSSISLKDAPHWIRAALTRAPGAGVGLP